MSEFWVSRKKWTCPYCDITINDDVPSRMQHENGLRHKGNVERSLKGTYRKAERERREEESARREMAAIERIHSTIKPSAATSSKTASAPDNTSWKPSDKLTAYGTVSDASYAQESYESTRLKEEQEAALREQELEQRRKEEGFVGEWETVAPSRPVVNRAPNAQDEGTEYEAARAFQVKEKTGLHARNDDEENATEEIKVKKRRMNDQEASWNEDAVRRRRLPQWQGLKLEPKREDSTIESRVDSFRVSGGSPASPKKEQDDSAVPPTKEVDGSSREPSTTGQSGAGADAPKSMFKKRKAGAGAGAKKVRTV
ncbi:WW DOMAIN BINDING PROTEIN 4 [Ceraceosorus bombacis]|uniref:WW DOMAIN BINDING PROTEIN 4 n=1 Tax=Ceraceosorus bombacis TaxID=401625 RepID=A0A0P1BJU6_9BASI|nr:WW DOMAIN BINDING PROTEIN 4 [Ceraceosorus bombacis]